MASKRKAGAEAVGLPKKVPKLMAGDSSDLIYGEAHSDPDYSFSEESSDVDEQYKETPATPFSTTSSKYPSELKTHLCPFEGCTKAFNRPARLQEHLRSHNNERIFKCNHDGCEKTFLRASHLNHHIKSAHTTIRDYVCDRPGCGKTFVTGTRLRRHLAAHDGRDKYRCTEYPPCNETFRKHSTLHKHIMTVHLHQKPFPCSYVDPVSGQKCPQAFDTAGHLRAHEARLHAENRFTCTECSRDSGDGSAGDESKSASGGVSFPTYAQLQAHIKAAHPPKCPNCPIVCSTSRELRRHLEVAHGDVSLEDRKVFPCTVPGCGRSFTKKGNLTVHVRTVHEGEKRFICGETDLSSSKKVEGWNGEGCGKRYGSKLSLEEHVRTAHMGLMNTKAERRERLGLKKPQGRSKPPVPSTLALLTGEGYAEETGRHIPCFIETCEYRFHRDYDLWVHMSSKHGCSEDEIQNLFTQRALLAHESSDNYFGIYGLDLDNGDSQQFFNDAVAPQPSGDMVDTGHEFDEKINDMNFFNNENDTAMQDLFDRHGEVDASHSMTPNEDMTLMDPVLSQMANEI
ncbi:hypothetical protein VTN77DRAFT_4190 [Rasamsonia byssochlamydoides]|uniref:uncharacterized protein n=1 Tax=Rasamsonia byssochlamydoides TaxID=89139 RepID=UPI0037446881